MEFNYLKATEPLQGGSLPFTTYFSEIPETHLIDIRRIKGWVDLGTTQWFWTGDPWIGNLMGKLQKNGCKGGLSYNFNQLRVTYLFLCLWLFWRSLDICKVFFWLDQYFRISCFMYKTNSVTYRTVLLTICYVLKLL